MNTTWKWDGQHIALVVLFVAALAWGFFSYVHGQPITMQLVGPYGLLVFSAALNFWKNPPNTPADAIQDALAAGAAANSIKRPGQRGCARLGPVLAIALVGVVGLSAAACGSSIFGQVAPPVVDCGEAIAGDAVAGMTILQIVTKESGRCGADIAQVITALLDSQKPAVQQSAAYAEAKKLRATLVARQGER